MSVLASLWEQVSNAFVDVAHADDEVSNDSTSPDTKESADDDESKDEAEDEDEDEDEDDDDDEDEDEQKDPLDELREKYTNTICHSFKHHFDECIERVTEAQKQDGYADLDYQEDCVEEFFHLQHCLNEEIKNVLFAKLR